MATLSYKSFQTQPTTSAATVITAPTASGSNSQIKNISGNNTHATLTSVLTVYKGGSAATNLLFTISLDAGQEFDRDILEVLNASQTLVMKVSGQVGITVNGNYLEFDNA